MNKLHLFLLSALLILYIAFLGSFAVLAQTIITASVEWNNDNIHTQEQPAPVEVHETHYGFWAYMQDGSFMNCYKLDNGFYRYEMGSAYWWIYYNKVVWGKNNIGVNPQADNDLQALSIALYE